MTQPFIIKELSQTSLSCPSQWEGWLDDGRPLYIRYRWARLSVRFGPPGGTIDDAVSAAPWFDETIGNDAMAGLIGIEEVLAVTGLVTKRG